MQIKICSEPKSSIQNWDKTDSNFPCNDEELIKTQIHVIFLFESTTTFFHER